MELSRDEFNDEQKEAIVELRKRLKDVISQDLYEDISLFYRFLEAREFRINDAENMLRKHIIWRKVYQVDSILEDFKPKEFFTKYVEPTMFKFDKEDNMVLYIPSGKSYPKEFYKCEKKNNFTKHLIWFAEKVKKIQMEHSKKLGRNKMQMSFIVDANQVTFENATCKESIDFWLTLMNIAQDNYPEYLKAMYVINAPYYCTVILSLVKTIVSNKLISKIHHFGTSGWREKLLEVIDADILPAFLGGNRTDPDGNPLCTTFVNLGGRIPAEYFLSNEERYFKKGSEVNKVIIPPSGKKNIFVDVKAKKAIIQWEFYCKNDIDFGLFYEGLDKKLEEIIPIVKYDTSSWTEESFYRTQSTGKYIIVFENTSSWLTKKEVEYCINLINQDL